MELRGTRYTRVDNMAKRLYYDGLRRSAFIAGVEYAYTNPMDMWIPVADALPTANEDGLSDTVLVCSDRDLIGLDCYDHNAKAWNASTELITHWMPLPALPKKEEIYK